MVVKGWSPTSNTSSPSTKTPRNSQRLLLNIVFGGTIDASQFSFERPPPSPMVSICRTCDVLPALSNSPCLDLLVSGPDTATIFTYLWHISVKYAPSFVKSLKASSLCFSRVACTCEYLTKMPRSLNTMSTPGADGE
jgi:hypothetical protein